MNELNVLFIDERIPRQSKKYYEIINLVCVFYIQENIFMDNILIHICVCDRSMNNKGHLNWQVLLYKNNPVDKLLKDYTCANLVRIRS